MPVFPTRHTKPKHIHRIITLLALALVSALFIPATAQAAVDPSTLSLAETTAVGVHRSEERRVGKECQ